MEATKSELGVYIIRHVAVAHGRHGDHCPPERVWDGLEEGVLGARLGEVNGAREQHDTWKEEEGWVSGVSLYLISPYPTVVIVTTAHQKASGIDLK